MTFNSLTSRCMRSILIKNASFLNTNYKLNHTSYRKHYDKNILFRNFVPTTNKRYLSTENTSIEPIPSTQLEKTSDKPNVSLSAQKSRKVVAERSYFDTYDFIQSLIQKGFTQEQAEQLCILFKDIVNYIAQDIKKECVTKPGQDLAIQQVMIHIGSLKKDMIILEKSEFYALRNENQKLIMDIKSLREQLHDEVVKLKGHFTLDINLEKNRANEMTYEVTNRVHRLDSRIDSEISNVKAMLEAFKAETVRYIAGSLFTGLVIILGALRYFSS